MEGASVTEREQLGADLAEVATIEDLPYKQATALQRVMIAAERYRTVRGLMDREPFLKGLILGVES